MCGTSDCWFGLVPRGFWVIVTPDEDIYPEKITNCDGATGPSAMRRLVLGRGSGPARDLPPGCGRVHRFATVPDEDALRRCGSGSPEAGQRRTLGNMKLDVSPWSKDWSFCLEVRRLGSMSSWRHPSSIAAHERWRRSRSTTNHKGFQISLGWHRAGKRRSIAGV